MLTRVRARTQPAMYRKASWFGLLPYSEDGRVGLSFVGDDGQAVRLALDIDSARRLFDALEENVRIPGRPAKT